MLLGAVAMKAMGIYDLSMTKARDYNLNKDCIYNGIRVFFWFHPSYVLRHINVKESNVVSLVKKDLLYLLTYLKEINANLLHWRYIYDLK